MRGGEGIVGGGAARDAARDVPPDDVTAVAVTSQWSGTVPIDRDGDAAARRDHLDGRTRRADDVKRRRRSRCACRATSRASCATGSSSPAARPRSRARTPIAHILWLRREHPDIARATWKYLEPKDWLNLKLTGRCAATYDSIVLHWITDNRDLAHIDYDPGLLRTLRRRPRRSSPISWPRLGARSVARRGRGRARCARGHPGGRRHSRSAVGRDRFGRGARLRGPSLRRHVVVAHVPRAVQEDRPVPRHRVAARRRCPASTTSPTSRRSRARASTGCATT